MESYVYCNQMLPVPLYLNCTQKLRVNAIILLSLIISTFVCFVAGNLPGAWTRQVVESHESPQVHQSSQDQANQETHAGFDSSIVEVTTLDCIVHIFSTKHDFLPTILNPEMMLGCTQGFHKSFEILRPIFQQKSWLAIKPSAMAKFLLCTLLGTYFSFCESY